MSATYLFPDEGKDDLSFRENSMELTTNRTVNSHAFLEVSVLKLRKLGIFLTKLFKAGILLQPCFRII